MGARQIPLDLGHRPGISRDDLILSRANEAAVELLDSWPGWPSPAIVLAGPVGSGKTHLASLWREEAGAVAIDIGRISADAIAEAAIRPVLAEDIDRQAIDENGLFHVLNAVRQGGTGMLMTARSFPATWPLSLPDLASRLRAVTVVEIGEPDDALLGGILAKLFADRQIEVDPSVIDYIVRRMERSAAAASHVVDLSDRLALERKSRITRQIAGQALGILEEVGA